MINKEQLKLDITKYPFSPKVINSWNNLPIDGVNTANVNLLKSRIDQYFLKVGYVCGYILQAFDKPHIFLACILSRAGLDGNLVKSC